MLAAGEPRAAAKPLDLAEADTPGDHQQARADLVRARLAFAVNGGGDSSRLLLDAARQLSAMGAAGFTERARRELLATGETVRRRTAGTDRDLTPQELQIALRAHGERRRSAGPTTRPIGRVARNCSVENTGLGYGGGLVPASWSSAQRQAPVIGQARCR